MRILFFALAIFFFTNINYAQIGFTGAYYSQRVPEWEAAVFGRNSNESLLSTGYSAELDYRITPLENYRVEVHPTLTYNASKSSTDLTNFELKQYEFSLKTNLYLLSMEADCDCPTFSREASILKKGFFLQIAPGISYFDAKGMGPQINTPIQTDAIVNSEGNGLNFKLGIGMGVDIGLSDKITITPIVKYNRYFKVIWDNLITDFNAFSQDSTIDGNNTTHISQFYGGIRLGIRFDK